MTAPTRFRLVYDPEPDNPNPHPWLLGAEYSGSFFEETREFVSEEFDDPEDDRGWVLAEVTE